MLLDVSENGKILAPHTVITPDYKLLSQCLGSLIKSYTLSASGDLRTDMSCNTYMSQNLILSSLQMVLLL